MDQLPLSGRHVDSVRGGKSSRGKGRGNTNAWNRPPRFRNQKQDPCNVDVAASQSDTVVSADERFQESALAHQKLREMHTEGYVSSEEEDNLDDEKILSSVLLTYVDNGGENNFNQDFLVQSLRSKMAACLICIATIRRDQPVWNCTGCFSMFHIMCIQQWIKDGIYQASYQSEDHHKQKIPWNCPKCRREYSQLEKPSRYLCFCRKCLDPKADPWILPHSCGQVCDQNLQPLCGHSCLLLCHPGPCPPCPKMVRRACFCGSFHQTRRCSSKLWSCSKKCGKKLACGEHTCQKMCHPGDCSGCQKTSSRTCRCGAMREEKPCSEINWQCGKICGQRLSCENHNCSLICHDGPCPPCPTSGKRFCPCGKTRYNVSCTESVSTCAGTCNKQLQCSIHCCNQPCHFGSCGMCHETVVKKCRCGAKQKQVQCWKDFTCETKCNLKKECGRHFCKRKCCDRSCQPCDQPCNRTMSCRNHKCGSRCHRGTCYPCTITVSVSCRCGGTAITVPCGREKKTKPPKCNLLCKLHPTCHHTSQIQHACHFDFCPPCKLKCERQYPNCPHVCQVFCHTAVLSKIQPKDERRGPWEPMPQARLERVDYPCPPCSSPVPVTCIGLHETVDVSCNVAKRQSCGRKCGRKLACGNHVCQKICHLVPPQSSLDVAVESCGQCEEICSLPRPSGCIHPCGQVCHPSPCEPCHKHIKMRCHCQMIVLYVKCNEWTDLDVVGKIARRSCTSFCPHKIDCGHSCQLKCHVGPCSQSKTCTEKIRVRCPCKRIKRDFLCTENQIGCAIVNCDSTCESIKQSKLQEEEKARKEKETAERLEQERQLEQFMRRRDGKRRKARQHRAEELSKSSSNTKMIVFASAAVLVAIGVFWLCLTEF